MPSPFPQVGGQLWKAILSLLSAFANSVHLKLTFSPLHIVTDHWLWGPCVICQTRISVLHTVMCMFQCYSLKSEGGGRVQDGGGACMPMANSHWCVANQREAGRAGWRGRLYAHGRFTLMCGKSHLDIVQWLSSHQSKQIEKKTKPKLAFCSVLLLPSHPFRAVAKSSPWISALSLLQGPLPATRGVRNLGQRVSRERQPFPCCIPPCMQALPHTIL